MSNIKAIQPERESCLMEACESDQPHHEDSREGHEEADCESPRDQQPHGP